MTVQYSTAKNKTENDVFGHDSTRHYKTGHDSKRHGGTG
jgi:hypothetical protein